MNGSHRISTKIKSQGKNLTVTIRPCSVAEHKCSLIQKVCLTAIYSIATGTPTHILTEKDEAESREVTKGAIPAWRQEGNCPHIPNSHTSFPLA